MSLIIVSAPDPTKLPIPLDLVKKQIHILPSETSEDDLLQMYIASAVDEFESHTGRPLITRTVRQSFDKFPCSDYFSLELANFQSLVSPFVEWADRDGTFTALDSNLYGVDSSFLCPRLFLKPYQVWPVNSATNQLNAVRATYRCGYGDSAENIPLGVQHIIAMIAADSYAHREDTEISPGVVSVIVTWASRRMMNKYKINYFPQNSQSL